jgi:hypothetical protein
MHACIVCESHSTYIVWSKQRQVQFLKRTCYFYPHWFWRDESQPSLAVGELGKDLHRHTYAAAVEALGTTTPGILKEGHSILKDELSLNIMVFNSAEQHGAQHTDRCPTNKTSMPHNKASSTFATNMQPQSSNAHFTYNTISPWPIPGTYSNKIHIGS